MTRKVFDLVAEPTGVRYRKLIDYSLTACNAALLVVQGSQLEASGRRVLDSLRPLLLEEARTSSWPGTILVGEGTEGATLRRYRLNEDCAAILKSAADGLYDWLQPSLPEDLSLLRPDGTAWLVSIAHERDAYLQITPEEYDLLRESIPELGPLLREAPG